MMKICKKKSKLCNLNKRKQMRDMLTAITITKPRNYLFFVICQVTAKGIYIALRKGKHMLTTFQSVRYIRLWEVSQEKRRKACCLNLLSIDWPKHKKMDFYTLICFGGRQADEVIFFTEIYLASVPVCQNRKVTSLLVALSMWRSALVESLQ